jgi:hypothetical protein
MPFDGGDHEIWYDFAQFADGDEPLEDSITTYWTFDDGSGALEYLADFDDAEVTVYVRWGDDGGRYDHHALYEDPDLGLVDDIATNCWAADGAELFDAWAVIDQALDYEGEIDGDEADCAFGPVADHPDPGADFDDLPEEGEWDDLELDAGGTDTCTPDVPDCD